MRRSVSSDGDLECGPFVGRIISGRYTIHPEEEKPGVWINATDTVEVVQ